MRPPAVMYPRGVRQGKGRKAKGQKAGDGGGAMKVAAFVVVFAAFVTAPAFCAAADGSGDAGAAGRAAARLRGGAERGHAAGRRDDERHGRRCLRPRRPPDRADAQHGGVLRVRRQRRVRALLRRQHVHARARHQGGRAGQHLGHRRRRPPGAQGRPHRQDSADARHQGRGGGVERGRPARASSTSPPTSRSPPTATCSCRRGTRPAPTATRAC